MYLNDSLLFCSVMRCFRKAAQTLGQGCQTYGPRAGSGPLDGLIRPGLVENKFEDVKKKVNPRSANDPRAIAPPRKLGRVD